MRTADRGLETPQIDVSGTVSDPVMDSTSRVSHVMGQYMDPTDCLNLQGPETVFQQNLKAGFELRLGCEIEPHLNLPTP